MKFDGYSCPNCDNELIENKSFEWVCETCGKKYDLDYYQFNEDGDEQPYLTEIKD